ncbi:hypothetical protein K432DRAFT_381198 [Lepidopterella palustris CBS 459.81]|uniref:Aminoglycoside phosphotransferase domain-containing protein n=1 Tax=Lepidopterella palustris CBS 459.81 TaxID=1314670 RepID=A0A8E2ED62_9PEZI|nr:hypothetical protein K432DRAFT_381198 [Lepidopterella palustris CBS 459.81]
MSPPSPLSFFQRYGLDDGAKLVCHEVVNGVYEGWDIRAIECQGYCSYTVIVIPKMHAVGERGGGREQKEGHQRDKVVQLQPSEIVEKARIVQFRPEQHKLDLSVTEAAKKVYGAYAPQVKELEVELGLRVMLRVYEVEFIVGMPYSRFQNCGRMMDEKKWSMQIKLVKGFAGFMAKGWRGTLGDDDSGCDGNSGARKLTGKVGANITIKLEKLAQQLPSSPLRTKARNTLATLPLLENLPVILNHGDIVPSNIMLDPSTGELIGLVDWAEAEWLPFGTCLYGLEHLLGWLDLGTSDARPQFVYYDRAEQLREVFWEELRIQIPEVMRWIDSVMLARDIGILLWFGYAWDEGRINRVVNSKEDAEELECLEVFLNLEDRRAMAKL